MPDKIVRSKMLRISNMKFTEDSDSVDENEELMKQGTDGEYYQLKNNIIYEKVLMV